MTLIEQAREIMKQTHLSPDDLIELSRIKREMSCLYADMSVLSAREESEYNNTRASGYISRKWRNRKDGKKMSDSDAEILAKNEAEKNFGSYREHKAECQWLREQIWALEWFIISIYHKNKRDAKIQ